MFHAKIQAKIMEPTNLQCHGEPKWFALINDKRIPAPGQFVKSDVLKQQAGLDLNVQLLRDHNSPNDPVMPDGQRIDLAAGNVFYSLEPCARPSSLCSGEPKRALSVDDRVEEIGQPQQTETSIRKLFEVPDDRELVRDYENDSTDQSLQPGEPASFKAGPVFVTRSRKGLKITVNSRAFTGSQGVKPVMTGAEIARLVVATADGHDVFRLETNKERTLIGLQESVPICTGQEFLVIRREVPGGFHSSRLERELNFLRESGTSVTLIEGPVEAVIYHHLPLRSGAVLEASDVLVPVPNGYPAAYLDWAYLPEGSPLLGKVPGAIRPHGAPDIIALGQTWVQVSYHPHVNGGGPPWDKEQHGFHTYAGELISWLHKA